MTLQPAVRKETGRIFIGTAILTALMVVVFWLLHRMMPDSVPFNSKVIYSGIIGCLIASLNFLLMGIAVQKIANMTNEDMARQSFTLSYRSRTMMQLVWAIVALAAPAFNGAAGIIPLLFPSLLIKAMGMRSGLRKEAES